MGEQAEGDIAVYRVVLDQQDAFARVPVEQLCFGGQAGAWVRLDGLGCEFLQAGAEPEGAAAPRGALHADLAAHQFGKFARDRQSQAGAAIFAGGRVVGLFKTVEQAWQDIGGNADAAVGDGKADQAVVVAFGFGRDLDADVALIGEFDRIAHVVDERLLQAGGVTLQARRREADLGADPDVLGAGAVVEQ